ncbi:hypothetical protein SSS_10887 [Sarcoptes scabiei]|uniref:Uncharacterized protein n=1 Tax=Sarcoptes scabiei TaxID=52283 RepID=A0A834R1M5_SARSC|nr:hypothetical protein SSS_10887 [Sarcoptes scabiei]
MANDTIPTTVIVIIWTMFLFRSNVMLPFQRCQTDADCLQTCQNYGYNRSECSGRRLRLNRFCECHDCDFVNCATYCTRNNMKFVGCSCFALPALIGQGNYANNVDLNQLLTNECFENKFLCQCSK